MPFASFADVVMRDADVCDVCDCRFWEQMDQPRSARVAYQELFWMGSILGTSGRKRRVAHSSIQTNEMRPELPVCSKLDDLQP